MTHIHTWMKPCVFFLHTRYNGVYMYWIRSIPRDTEKVIEIFFKLPLKMVEYPFDNIKFDRVHRIGCSSVPRVIVAVSQGAV